MLRASWASLMARKLRLFMSAFAVMLGVAFVAGSFIFTDTLAQSFNGITRNTVGDVIVAPAGAQDSRGREDGGSSLTVDASVLPELARVPGAARADGNITMVGVFVVSKAGKVLGGAGPPALGVNHTGGPAAHGVQPFSISRGVWPKAKGEIALDSATAQKAGYVLGESVPLLTVTENARVEAKLVGIVDSPGLLGATVTVFDTAWAQQIAFKGKPVFSTIWVTAAPGTSQDQLKAAVDKVLPKNLESVTGDAQAKKAATGIQKALGFVNQFLLVFAAVALVVGTFLIVNTFSILVVQRSRELALFRAIGATRRQVGRSVLFEAFIVGLVGSTIGLLLGFVLAWAIARAFGTFGLDLSGTALVLRPRTAIAAYAVGVLVTLFAAYLPARRAGKVPPVAAMRDDVQAAEGGMGKRLIVGLVFIVLGAGAMYAGLFHNPPHQLLILGVGILFVLLGVAFTSPVLGRPLTATIGAAYRAVFGVVGTMATQNAVRNPRRTAATASALMIGVTLVTMMAIFGNSAKASVDKAIAKDFVGDYVVSAAVGQGFSASIATQVAKVPGVGTAAAMRAARLGFGDTRTYAVAVRASQMQQVLPLKLEAGSLAELSATSVAVEKGATAFNHVQVGSKVTFKNAGQSKDFTVAAIYDKSAMVSSDFLFDLSGFTALGVPEVDNYVYVKRAPGASPSAVLSGIERALAKDPLVSVNDQAAFAEQQRKPINQLLYIIYALLGLAVVIAVLGIINTLALSVIERTREIGLLRAVGLSRRQLRSMLRLESVVIALLGATLGVVLGTIFGIAIQHSLADDGIDTLAIPWGQLVIFLVLAGLVGILAALWPGRRAARLDILRAITTE